MAKTIVRSGQINTCINPAETIRTSGLGSCVAVFIYDNLLKHIGLANVVLPSSDVSSAKAEEEPGYFADTAIPAVIAAMEKTGSKKSDLVVKIAGGANIVGDCDEFNIGKMNINAVRKALWANDLKINMEDIGGHFNRTVEATPNKSMIQIIDTSGRSWTI